jgi:HEAT repeat protein
MPISRSADAIRKLITHLTLAVVGLAGGDALADVKDLPSDTALASIDTAVAEDWAPVTRARLLRALAAHPDRDVRIEVARRISDLAAPPPRPAMRTLIQLAGDGTPEVRAAVAHGLAAMLQRTRPIEATHLASRWASSTRPELRLAVAGALEWRFPLVGDDLILEHLAIDPDPAIRAAVARAAWSRDGAVGERVLARLLTDADPEVREIAALARRPG